MADHAKPAVSDTYTDVLAFLDGRLDDLSRWNGTAHATPTNLVTGAIRWNATTFKWDTWNGTDWNTPLTSRLDIAAFNGSIGATSPNTGAFTTLSTSGVASLGASSTVGGVAIVTLSGTQTLTNKTMSTGSVWNGGIIPLLYGGTGSSTSAGAPFAIKGANADITSISTITELGNTASTHIRISTGGLVGINGIADAGVRLHVKDTNAAIKSEGTSGYGSFYATGSAGQSSHMFFGTAGTETGRISVTSTGILTISNGSGATERIRINASGKVGVGSASLGQILEVTENLDAPTVLVIRNTNAGTAAQSLIQFTNNTKYVNQGIDPTGNYFLTFAAGGIVNRFDRFDTHNWQTVSGTTTAFLDSSGVLTARTSVRARTATGTHGFIGLTAGSATQSGYVEFFAHTSGVRQAYIGFSTSNAALNSGTLPYVAGTHDFTGDILANGKLGVGIAAGSYILNVATSAVGTPAVARIANTAATGYVELAVASNDRSLVLGQRSSTHASGDLAYIYSATATPIGVYTNGISRLVVQSTGHTVPGANNTYTLGASGLVWSNVYATLFTGPVTALKSATTSVEVSAATAPSNGQVLMATSSTAATWQTVSTSPPKGHIDGLIMSTAGSSATMTIGAGQATDSSGTFLMSLASSLAKTTGSWAVGTATGGLDTGTIAINTWYHFYLIRRPDTGVVDVCFSTSASAPTLPTNYTQYRRIGSGRTNSSSQWLSFTQVGDEFIWPTPYNDVNGTLNTTHANYVLTVPSGVNVVAKINANLTASADAQAYLNSPIAADDTANTSGRVSLSVGLAGGSTAVPGAGHFDLLTNTLSQVQARATTTTTISIGTMGWIDPRGRNV